MKKKRVLVLLHRDLVPPESASKQELEKAEWKTEYYVVSGLKKLGHDVQTLGVVSDLNKISVAITEFKPHIAFNLLEEFDGEALFDQNVVSFLELKGLAYTGCSPRGLILARDKAISKKILSYHRIPFPRFQVFSKSRKIRLRKDMAYPLFVKSLFEEASLGISQASVVHNDESLIERVQFIHESVGTDAIVERYIDGRELYVGVLGNKRVEVFPPWELVFKNAPDSMNLIATAQVKHNPDYRTKHGITTMEATNMDEALKQTIQKLCRRVYKALALNGYARIDLRLDENDTPYVLEANPNPEIADYEDFAMSAYYAGYEYEQLLERILQVGLSRPKNLY